MKRRCVLWGAARGYEAIINQVKFEELKGNLERIAILFLTLNTALCFQK